MVSHLVADRAVELVQAPTSVLASHGPSGPVGAKCIRWARASQGPTIVKSMGFWTTGLIFGSFERELSVESAERISMINFLLLSGNEYFAPCNLHREKLTSLISVRG